MIPQAEAYLEKTVPSRQQWLGQNQYVMADTMACTTVSFVLSSYFLGEKLKRP